MKSPSEEQRKNINEWHELLLEPSTFTGEGFGQEELAPIIFFKCMEVHFDLRDGFGDSFDTVKRRHWKKYLGTEAPATESELLDHAMSHWCKVKFIPDDTTTETAVADLWEPYTYMFKNTQKIELYGRCREFFDHFLFLMDCFHLVANRYKMGDEEPTREEWKIMQKTAYCYRYFIWDMYQYRMRLDIIFAQNRPSGQLRKKILSIHNSMLDSSMYRVTLRDIFGAHAMPPWCEFMESWQVKDTKIQKWLIDSAHSTMMARLLKKWDHQMYENIADNNIVGYVSYLLEKIAEGDGGKGGREGEIAILAVIHAYFVCSKRIPFSTNIIWEGIAGINKNRCGGFPRFVEITAGEFGLCYPEDVIYLGSVYQLVELWIEFIRTKGSMFPSRPSGLNMVRMDDLTDYEIQDLDNSDGGCGFNLDPYGAILKTDVYQTKVSVKEKKKKDDELIDRF